MRYMTKDMELPLRAAMELIFVGIFDLRKTIGKSGLYWMKSNKMERCEMEM